MTSLRDPSLDSHPASAIIYKSKKKKNNTLKLNENRKHVRQSANLFEKPSTDSRLPWIQGCEVTLGDLHANAIKLIHFLLKQDFIEMDEADYHLLLNLYYKQAIYKGLPKQEQFNKADREKFAGALARVRVNPKLKAALEKSKLEESKLEGSDHHTSPLTTLIRLLGDETGDRGSLDLLVLLAFNPLADNEIPYKILASNHGYEFLRWYETGFKEFKPQFLKDINQANSILELQNLLKEGGNNPANAAITPKELSELYERNILSHLELIDFTLDEASETLTIYTHGRVGLQTLQDLANELRAFVPKSKIKPFKWNSAKDIAKTLKQMNQDFASLKEKKCVSKFMDYSLGKTGAFSKLLWNRKYEKGDSPSDGIPDKAFIHFVHGHTDGDLEFREDKLDSKVTNLDNIFGKMLLMFMGEYSVLMEGPKKIRLSSSLDVKCEIEKECLDDQRKRLKTLMESKDQEEYVTSQLKKIYKNEEDLKIRLDTDQIEAPTKEFERAYRTSQKAFIALREQEQKPNSLQEKEELANKYAQARASLLQNLCYYLKFKSPQMLAGKQSYSVHLEKFPHFNIFFFEMVMYAREISLRRELTKAKEKEQSDQLEKENEHKAGDRTPPEVVVEPVNITVAFTRLDAVNIIQQEADQLIQEDNFIEAEIKMDTAHQRHLSAMQWFQLAQDSESSQSAEYKQFETRAQATKEKLNETDDTLEQARQTRILSQIQARVSVSNSREVSRLRWKSSDSEDRESKDDSRSSLSASKQVTFYNNGNPNKETPEKPSAPAQKNAAKGVKEVQKSSAFSCFSFKCGGK